MEHDVGAADLARLGLVSSVKLVARVPDWENSYFSTATWARVLNSLTRPRRATHLFGITPRFFGSQ